MLLVVLNAIAIRSYETRWAKDDKRDAFASWAKDLEKDTFLLLDGFPSLITWRFYRQQQPNQSQALTIDPNEAGPFGLTLITLDQKTGILQYTPITCIDLPPNVTISLYDQHNRLEQEGERWPDCVLARLRWRFDIQTLKWCEVSPEP